MIERDFKTMVWMAHVAGELMPAAKQLRLEDTLKQFAAPLHEQVSVCRKAGEGRGQGREGDGAGRQGRAEGREGGMGGQRRTLLQQGCGSMLCAVLTASMYVRLFQAVSPPAAHYASQSAPPCPHIMMVNMACILHPVLRLTYPSRCATCSAPNHFLA
jgi:hypothetical protein